MAGERFRAVNQLTEGVAPVDLSGLVDVNQRLLSKFTQKRSEVAAEETAEQKRADAEYLSGSKNDILESVQRVQLDNPDDVEAFDRVIQATRSGIVEGADERHQADLSGMFDAIETRARLSVTKAESSKRKAGQFAEAENTNDQFKTQIFNNSRAGESSTDLINEAFIHLDQMVESGLIKASAASSEKKEIRRESKEQSLKHIFGETAEIDGVSAALSDLNEIEPPSDWQPDQWDTFKKGVRADLMRQQARANAVESQARKIAQKSVKQYIEAVGTGFDVSPEEKSRVIGAAAGFPELESALGLVEDLAAFSLTSFSDRQDIMAAGQTGKLADSVEFAGMVSSNSKINKMAQEDAYTLGVSQGIIERTIFDPADPETLEERVLQAESLSEHYGVQASPLTSGEVATLTESLDLMTVPEKVALGETLSIAPELWGEIAKKGGGTFAMAGATGDKGLMGQVFKGQELIASKLVVPPKSSDFLGDFSDFVGGTYGSEDAMNVKNAAIAWYAANSVPGDDYDSSLFDDALQAVTGGITEINGFKVEIPRGVDPDVFEDFIDDMQPGTVAAMGGIMGMTDEEAATAISRGTLIGVKSGAYTVTTNFGTLLNSDGSTFILEWDDETAELNSLLNKTLRSRERVKSRGRRLNAIR